MQDQKNNLSTSNFKKEHHSFLKWTLVFFIPVVILFAIVEMMVLQIPLNYISISNYLDLEKENIEVMVLGSSQGQKGINPRFISKHTVNLSSTSQHHNLDYAILSQTLERLPKLKYVFLELSYSHLELPHHSKDFWKNNIYLKYYDVNAFQRKTYFKDKLIYLSNANLYSKYLVDHFIRKLEQPVLNKFGFAENDFSGLFKEVNYSEDIIRSKKFKINLDENMSTFKNNTQFFYEFLEYAKNEKLEVIIYTMPMHKAYLDKRNLAILSRRDSILKFINKNYDHVKLFQKEADTLLFNTTDFLNHNHLNPNGAEKFSKALNAFILEEFTD